MAAASRAGEIGDAKTEALDDRGGAESVLRRLRQARGRSGQRAGLGRASSGDATVPVVGSTLGLIFVDTNLFAYAVGRPHPLREDAREFFAHALAEQLSLMTSVEVMQELLHMYLPVRRMDTLDAAYGLIEGRLSQVLPMESEDVRLARLMADVYPELDARDLIHLAVCQRRGIREIKTFDRALDAVARRAL